MSFAPFPAPDLAKLVLGYLMEEQLMTAYDEFLQASPYLDAFVNEYDRLCMISLRNILSEYRAMRLLVESCKPIELRRKLLQCSNLYEMVKLLIANVDIEKLCDQDSYGDHYRSKMSITNSRLNTSNERQTSINQSRRQTHKTPPSKAKMSIENQNESIMSEEMDETDPIKQVNEPLVPNIKNFAPQEPNFISTVLEKVNDCILEQNEEISEFENSQTHSNRLRQNEIVSNMGNNDQITSLECTEQILVEKIGDKNNLESQHVLPTLETNLVPPSNIDLPVSTPHINNTEVLNVQKPVEQNVPKLTLPLPTVNSDIQRVYKQLAENFQDYCSPVREPKPIESEKVQSTKIAPKPIVTSQISPNFQTLPAINATYIPNLNHLSNKIESNITPQTYTPLNLCTIDNNHTNNLKDTQKIIILSDVKFEQVPKRVFSPNPLQLCNKQSKLVSQKENEPQKCIYTKDEIMAMPTIFVASPAKSKNRITNQLPAPSLKSLMVEVPTLCSKTSTLDIEPNTNTNENNLNPTGMLLKCVESNKTIIPQPTLLLTTSKTNEISITSVSQNNEITDVIAPNENSLSSNVISVVSNVLKTPDAPLPVKKSSSTPRRSSHIRVLDFNTPRRPINDVILENCEDDTKSNESPNVRNLSADGSICASTPIEKKSERPESNDVNVNNKKVNFKSRNWDADLRALIASDDNPPSKVKSKIYKKKKRPPECEDNEIKSNKMKKKSKSHRDKSKDNSNESIQITPECPNIRPTINLITERKTSRDKTKEEKYVDPLPPQEATPEVDPIFLQHDIEAKLSISDILNTPYKQELLNLQMDTPRFLGPEFAGEPLSDIKIMNIPTPRFLSTPKVQSTPSYSSRPTDYSSGGSYYKPDDNDYPALDDLTLPATSSPKEEITKSVTNKTIKNNTPFKTDDKSQTPNKRHSLRPVRKCTKNVSYYDVANNKGGVHSTNTDYTSTENLKNRGSNESETKIKSKSDSSRKRSTPKINPRVKKTPSKKSAQKSKKSSSITERRVSCKDITTIPIATPAKRNRKSSTPRKIECTKKFDDLELLNSIQEDLEKEKTENQTQNLANLNIESKCEEEDIAKIQEYIEKTANAITDDEISNQESALLRLELMKRGFDASTAKEIERDLTDKPVISRINSSDSLIYDEPKITPELHNKEVKNTPEEITLSVKTTVSNEEIADNINVSNEEECEDFEFSINECDESSHNFINVVHEEGRNVSDTITPFKDKYCMEICLEDIVIRLNATPFVSLITEDPKEPDIKKFVKNNTCEEESNINEVNEKTVNIVDLNDSYIRHYQEETEAAVQSISSCFDRYYTPKKQLTADEAKCVEIFDSSLASLDTPIKVDTPKPKFNSLQQGDEEKVSVYFLEQEVKRPKITVEIESIEENKSEIQNIPKKRKRSVSIKDDKDSNVNKKSKKQYLNNTPIFDIESVLSRLHGPKIT